MSQVLQYRRSLAAAAAPLTDEEIRERHLKNIEEITKNLTPPKFANLTEDQQEALDRKGRYAPYHPIYRAKDEEDEEYY